MKFIKSSCIYSYKGFEMRRFLQIKSFARTYLEIGLRKDVEGKFILNNVLCIYKFSSSRRGFNNKQTVIVY